MATPTTEPLPLLAPQLDSEPPIQLTNKKIVASEIPAVKLQPTAGGLTDLALEPTVQVKVDPDGVPLTLPALRPTNTPPPERAPGAPVARHKTPIPARVTPAAAFDAVEADFFAREADLYKREAVETFDDLDPSGGGGGGEQRPTTRRRRK